MHTPLPNLAPALDRFPEVGLAIVYGSVSNGTAARDSDLDIGVMGERRLSMATRMRILDALSNATGRAVDLVDLRTTHGTLLGEILRTGVRVSERDATLFPDLLRRHLIDEADFRPYRDRILAERRRAWIGES